MYKQYINGKLVDGLGRTLDVYEKNDIYYPKIFHSFLVFGCM